MYVNITHLQSAHIIISQLTTTWHTCSDTNMRGIATSILRKACPEDLYWSDDHKKHRKANKKKAGEASRHTAPIHNILTDVGICDILFADR